MSGTYHTAAADSAAYAKGYAVFLPRTNFRSQIVSAVKERVVPHIQGNRDRPLTVLDLGCGDGTMTAAYLRAHRERHAAALYTVDLVEPSDTLTTACTAVSSVAGVTHVSRFACTAEQFFSAATTQTQLWDWIIASHVFYHVDPATLITCADQLTASGLLLMTMGAPGHPLRQHAVLKALSRHVDLSTINSSLEVLQTSDRFHIETIDVPTELNLRGLRGADGKLNEDGAAFYSFIYNYDVQRFTAPQWTELKSILDEMETAADNVMRHAHRITVIRKKR